MMRRDRKVYLPGPNFDWSDDWEINSLPEDWPDHYQDMLNRELDDDGTPDGGHSVRQQHLYELKETFDAEGMWWKGDRPLNTDGTWVSNEAPWRQPDRKGRVIDTPDPELRHAYLVNTRDGVFFGGVRPSKRKAVK